MKKIGILLIGMLVISLGMFSGCTDITDQLGDIVGKMTIDSFQATPGIINEGETSTLSWIVTGATTVEIDNGIGNVSLIGTRIVTPTETTTYTLTARDENSTQTATAQVIVREVANQTPDISWVYDSDDFTVTITSGSSAHHYSETTTDGNLIFKKDTISYYVKSDLSISANQSGLSIDTIDAGDIITGFTTGTWQVVWDPTSEILGEIDFTTTPDYPNLAWTTDDSADTLTIASGSSVHTYGETATDGNLIFKKDTTSYYVTTTLALSSIQSGLSTDTIDAGDIITGFTTGTWQVIWNPTNTLLGQATFTASTPSISWTVNDVDDTITITSGSSSHYYAETSTNGNLIFDLENISYYVTTNFSISSTQSGLSTDTIDAGDTITGFTTGTWQIIWKPTLVTLGQATFTASTPSLSWTIDDSADTLTITVGSAHTYGETPTDGNLKFHLENISYYVTINLTLSSTQSGLSTDTIDAGDTITGFTTGTWQIIWDPTSTTLGQATFTANYPDISWTADDTNNKITITVGAPSFTYGASQSDGNLIFKHVTDNGTYYYVQSNLAITKVQSNLSTAVIQAGDIITGFATGEWEIIWEPTGTSLGTFEFTTPYPNLAWIYDDADNTITITSGSSSHTYGETTTDGNLIFKLNTTSYYVKSDLSISTDQTNLSTDTIDAGDEISGFTAGTWQIIWDPNDEVLGTYTFT
ncbi:MAG: hypothetical protein KAW45_04030 [Thermoplasmatales archaeon]|nr:hypothetical protein [Thermoplasmatales archaeon]